jgi:hypothetical protein
MLYISIPEPCHEDWNAMTPDEQGRHCNACNKTVVDFTQMSTDEIKHYFIQKATAGASQNTCSRFLNQQLSPLPLQIPPQVFEAPGIPLWKKFLAACLIAFGTLLLSCTNHTQKGDLLPTPIAKTAIEESAEKATHIAREIEPGFGKVGMISYTQIDSEYFNPDLINCTLSSPGVMTTVGFSVILTDSILHDLPVAAADSLQPYPDATGLQPPRADSAAKDSLKRPVKALPDSLHCDSMLYYLPPAP